MGQVLGCIQVDRTTVVVREQFGKFDAILKPGCHCLPWCFGYQASGTLSLGVHKLNVRVKTKTRDNVFVTVVASIHYCALRERVFDAFYKLSNPRSQIQAFVFDVIRSSMPKFYLDSAFEQRNEIGKTVKQELRKVISAYGYGIVRILIIDIEPDAKVKKTINEINAAARMRVAAKSQGEAERMLRVKRSEGEAEAKYLLGLGIARQREVIVNSLRDSVLSFSGNVPGTTAKDIMDMVLITHYFDTMKEVGTSSKSSVVFTPHEPGAVKDIASHIQDGMLQGKMKKNKEKPTWNIMNFFN